MGDGVGACFRGPMLCRANASSVSQVGLDAATDSVLFQEWVAVDVAAKATWLDLAKEAKDVVASGR